MATSPGELFELAPEAPTPEEVAELDRGLEALLVEREARLRAVRRGLDEALAQPDRLRNLWRQWVQLAAPGSSGKLLHPLRDVWFRLIDRSLSLIRLMIRVVPRAADLAGSPPAGADRLPAVLREVEQFRDLFAERWQTADDVEDMVLAETDPLPPALLDALADKYRPPAEWYDEGVKPW